MSDKSNPSPRARLARSLATPLLVLAALGAPTAAVQAQVCALPGSDPATAASGIVNTYHAGTGSLPSGATSLALGAIDPRGAATAVRAGDLLLVIQMQDGSLSNANNNTYGSGSGTGQGTTSVGNAGLYEFVRVDSVAGSTVGFSPALTHGYVTAGATTVAGQKRYQVVRVPQYATVSVAGVTAPAWNGATGGVVAIDASGVLTLSGATVEGQTNRAIFVAGRGFRGAAGVAGSSDSNDAQWRSTSNAHGGKGEGIAGTPRLMSNKSNNYGAAVTAASLSAVDTGVQGYPGGDYARGAPGNAGGGGTEGTGTANSPANDRQRNAGGGGGGNYAAGGLGGRPWNAPLNDTNGRGGAGYAGTIGFGRVFMGGGGGGGGTNNATSDSATYENRGIGCSAGALCSSGAAGGGIVILRARTITGSGVIDVRGAPGYNVLNDAGGGGGAGGTVVLQTTAGGNATVDGSGGDGGNAWAGRTGGNPVADRHGPGGGGGGGYVAYSPGTFSVTATLDGGTPGRTSNGVSDTYGSNGNNGGLSGFQPPNVPGVDPGASCFPDLRLAKTNGVTSLENGTTTTYTLTVTNQGGGPTSGTATVVDVLPAGITIPDGAVPLTGPQAANWSCSAASGVVTCTTTSALASGAQSAFAFVANVESVPNASSATNRARIGGGGDPSKPVPTSTTTSACTGNDTPAGCAVDVDTVSAPLVTLAKTDNTDVVVSGGTTTYQLTVANGGAAPTAGTIRVVDVLPAGMTYTGAASFTSGGFACTWTAATRSFSCDRATAIAAGGSTVIALPVRVEATNASALTNRAQVGGGADPGKLTLPTVATATACPAPVPPATIYRNDLTGCASDTDAVTNVALALEKDDGQPFMARNGQTTYQLRVRNSGSADSSGTIHVRDVLPAPMTWPATLVLGGPDAAAWACTRVSATVAACTSNTVIPVGGVSQFSLLANVGAAGVGQQYLNRARVGGGGDADLPPTLADGDVTGCSANNIPAGCAVDLNTVQEAPQVRLSKSHPDPQARLPGETVTFNLVVANSGGTDTGTAEIRVVDVLPTGLAYTGPASFSSGGFSCAHAGGTITCNRSSNLAAGATATISFTATVAASATGTLLNKGQVAGGGDPQLGASTTISSSTAAQCVVNGAPFLGCATDPVPVTLNADLSITKTNNQDSVLAGSTVTYVVVANNAGPAAANGARVRDVATSGLTCTTATCGSPQGGATCPAATGPALLAALQSAEGVAIPTMPNGGAVTFSVTCTVD